MDNTLHLQYLNLLHCFTRTVLSEPSHKDCKQYLETEALTKIGIALISVVVKVYYVNTSWVTKAIYFLVYTKNSIICQPWAQ